ncbi:hypothetical protein HK097_009355 [Rhizophlyctis rosea]|uniref:Uncharacterized protein n=1 Tax=Rhizophlyctis rosea TaxID=64517 RepID=A0AAD5SHA8_9FUNG|nr:hypothetical protein HK097_009355 [Rhizophlyctis rosea]
MLLAKALLCIAALVLVQPAASIQVRNNATNGWIDRRDKHAQFMFEIQSINGSIVLAYADNTQAAKDADELALLYGGRSGIDFRKGNRHINLTNEVWISPLRGYLLLLRAPGPTQPPSAFVNAGRVNFDCNDGCCSREFSNDNAFKCTPGGRQCTGIGRSGGGKKGDWAYCSQNSECSNGCCSREFSGDNALKCTPGGRQGGGSGGGNTAGGQLRITVGRNRIWIGACEGHQIVGDLWSVCDAGGCQVDERQHNCNWVPSASITVTSGLVIKYKAEAHFNGYDGRDGVVSTLMDQVLKADSNRDSQSYWPWYSSDCVNGDWYQAWNHWVTDYAQIDTWNAQGGYADWMQVNLWGPDRKNVGCTIANALGSILASIPNPTAKATGGLLKIVALVGCSG